MPVFRIHFNFTHYIRVAQIITRANHTLIRVSQKMLMHVKRDD
jgi:hypothetical protein